MEINEQLKANSRSKRKQQERLGAGDQNPALTGGWKGGVLDFCGQISKVNFCPSNSSLLPMTYRSLNPMSGYGLTA